MCSCRNISDTDPNWKELIMKDDHVCGKCKGNNMDVQEELNTAMAVLLRPLVEARATHK